MTLDYDSIVFDCDGVILDSNHLKSDAFGQTLAGYDADAVARFVAWHKATGGVSRYRKFEEFFASYVTVADPEAAVSDALRRFGEIVFNGLVACNYIPGFDGFLNALPEGLPRSINTGGDQAEVRQVMQVRGVASMFSTILGSPQSKRDNMISLKSAGLIGDRGLYFGDSRLDHELANEFGLHFVFVSGSSEWASGAAELTKGKATIINDFNGISPEMFRFSS